MLTPPPDLPRFDEQPHLYAIKGEEHVVVVDTGTGEAMANGL